jgi:hypothetical protein
MYPFIIYVPTCIFTHDYTLFTYEDLATVLMRRNNGAEDNMTGDVA